VIKQTILAVTAPPLAALGLAARLLDSVGARAATLAGWIYLLIALYICFDVISRKFFGFSSRATVEVSSYLLAFALMWGLLDTLTHRAHIRVDIVVNRLPLGIRGYLHTVAIGLLCAFGALLAKESWDVVLNSVALDSHDTSALNIQLALPQGAWAIGITMFAVLAVVLFLRSCLLLLRGELPEVESLLGARTLEEELELEGGLTDPVSVVENGAETGLTAP